MTDIASFIDIYDKKYAVILNLYIPIKHIKTITKYGMQVEINGRYFYKFDTEEIADKYISMILEKFKGDINQ